MKVKQSELKAKFRNMRQVAMNYLDTYIGVRHFFADPSEVRDAKRRIVVSSALLIFLD